METFFDSRNDDVRLKLLARVGVGVVGATFGLMTFIGAVVRLPLAAGLTVLSTVEVGLGVEVLSAGGGENSSSSCRFADKNGS